MRRLANAAITLVLLIGHPSAQTTPADLVLRNGKILTVDARDSIAQAVAIVGGRIVVVGSNDDVRARIGAATQVIDLGGRYSVTPFPARYGLWASVARTTLNGSYGATPFGLKESVDIRTALRSYTIWAAHQLFLDDRIGSIEVAKDADLTVWDRDLYTVPADQLKDLKCELTLSRGQVVYRAATK